MKIIQVKDRTLILIEQLVELWEKSVKEMHLFLWEDEIESIKMYVPQALKDIGTLVIIENEINCPISFMGVQEEKLEMLFILPKERRKGLGKKLFQYGIENYSIEELTVNEQNTPAKGFYEHMGFKVYKRTEYDEQGQPYPLLYMRLN